MIKLKNLIIALILLLFPANLTAVEGLKFIGELPTPGEYSLFASGGWDGNWFVGSTQGWVTILPPVDTSGYEHAFIGARLGRAKTLKQIKQVINKQAEEEEIQKPKLPQRPGRIKIGISHSLDDFPDGLLLAETNEIPLEGSSVEALRGVDGSRWFFKEIDMEKISSDSENYIFLFSPDEFLNSTAVAPILAAGIGSEEEDNTYILKDSEDPAVIRFFEPAIALKLVEGATPRPHIEIKEYTSHPHIDAAQTVVTEVRGENISRAWLEINDGRTWKQTGYPEENPPYDFIFEYGGLQPGNYRIRAGVKNWWENTTYSRAIEFRID